MKSPCIGCKHELEDKNTHRCADCEKRIEYAEEQLMIPNEALEADRAAREETRKIREIRKPKSNLKAGFELFQRSKEKRGRLPRKVSKVPEVKPEDKELKDESLRKGIYIRPTEFCPTIQIQEILEGVKEIANSELRSLPQQVLWILKEKVEDWKKEHG